MSLFAFPVLENKNTEHMWLCGLKIYMYSAEKEQTEHAQNTKIAHAN